MKQSILLSEAQLRGAPEGSFRYVSSLDGSGMKKYGQFRVSLSPEFHIHVSHHFLGTAGFNLERTSKLDSATNPDFPFRFNLLIDRTLLSVELNPGDFKEGLVDLDLSSHIPGASDVQTITNNVNTNHPVFF